MKISSSIQHVAQLLKHHSNARLESELLISHLLQKKRSYLFAHPEQALTPQQLDQLHQLVRRRVAGEPIAYLLEEKEFWSLPLKVTKDTLIPRPETEMLVELTLQLLPQNAMQKVADLGTGTGAVALAIASERPNWQIVAVDNADAALAVARENAARLEIHTVEFLKSDWCEALPKIGYNAIVSNPPYIAEMDKHLDEGDVRFEPKAALVAENDGLKALNHIILEATKYLTKNGWLLVEHGYDQGKYVREMMAEAGYGDVATKYDLSGHERVTMASIF